MQREIMNAYYAFVYGMGNVKNRRDQTYYNQKPKYDELCINIKINKY